MSIINRLKNLFRAAKLLSVNDSGDLRLGVVTSLGKSQSALIFSPYGLMHNPPPDSLVIIWNQQGQESNSIGIADDPRNRPLKNLAPGEVAVGNYSTGNFIYFDKNGLCTLAVDDLAIVAANDITITAKNLTANIEQATTITSGTVDIDADTDMDLTATDINVTSVTMEHNSVNVGGSHIHSQGNDSGGDTEVDTGVPHS